MEKRSLKRDSEKQLFGITKSRIAVFAAVLFAALAFLGCPTDESSTTTEEYPATLEGTVWCGPTGGTGSPWATFVFHDKSSNPDYRGTAVYYFSDHPTDIPPQASGDPDRRTPVDYEYFPTGGNAGSGTIDRYAADAAGTYNFQLGPDSTTITITNFGTPPASKVFNRVAQELDEDSGDEDAPLFDPNPWTPAEPLPSTLLNTVWMGKAPNGGWLTITVRAATTGAPPTAPITASFSVDNSTNDWTVTYYGATGTTGGAGGSMTGMGTFDINTAGTELTFTNFYSHAGPRTYYRYR
jgi:hypothetical protein